MEVSSCRAQPATREEQQVIYYIYENWQAGPRKAVIHRADCGHCNNGRGRSKGDSERGDGRALFIDFPPWPKPPMGRRDLAESIANSTNLAIRFASRGQGRVTVTYRTAGSYEPIRKVLAACPAQRR